jgi:tripartite-type tricarboxylate transporter receptor subunit TctC
VTAQQTALPLKATTIFGDKVNITKTFFKLAIGLTASAALGTSAAWAQSADNYPNQPIKIVVGYSAGGTTDILARTLARKLNDELGQPVIVENRPGAAGSIGATSVQNSDANGYTLYMATVSTHGMNPAVYGDKMTYDPINGFEPISMVAVIPLILIINSDLPFNDVKGLIAYGKQNPGKLNYSSSGVGSPVHVGGAMFADAAGIDMVHIPYKGGKLSNTSVLAGDTQMSFATMPAALPLVNGGKVKALAVTTAKRANQLPNTPTIEEAGGLTGYEINTWNALLAPKGTSAAIVNKLNSAIGRAMADPEVTAAFEKAGAIPETSTPAETAAFINSQITKWNAIIGKLPMNKK